MVRNITFSEKESGGGGGEKCLNRGKGEKGGERRLEKRVES